MKNILKNTIFLLALISLISCKDDVAEAYFDLEKDKAVFTAEAGIQRINVKGTPGDMTFYKESPDDTWYKLTRSDGQLVVEVSANPDSEQRSATVVVEQGFFNRSLTIEQLGAGPAILPESDTYSAANHESTVIIRVVSNTEYEVEIPQKDGGWLSVIPATVTRAVYDEEIHFRVEKNLYNETRSSTVVLTGISGDASVTITITQEAGSLGLDEVELGDVLIRIAGGRTSSEHPTEPFQRSFDGDRATRYHSLWEPKALVEVGYVDMVYWFAQQADVDYICYYPRAETENGLIGEFDLYYKTDRTDPEYTLVGTYDFEQRGTSILMLEERIEGAIEFKFTVKSGKSNDVSCAEMEFYTKRGSNISTIFADEIYSELLPGVTLEDIEAITEPFYRNIAKAIFEGTYPEWRVQQYEAYRPISTLAKELRTNNYNRFENPTGIFADSGEEIIVFAEQTGESVALRIRNFESDTESVHIIPPAGVKVKVTEPSLLYVSYFTENFRTAQPVKVHITGGRHNGRFDRHENSAAEWSEILANTVSPFLDMRGDYIHMVFKVDDLRQNCTDGMTLLEAYDNIVYTQYDIMGLVKYERIPKNRMFCRWVLSGYFADGTGAGFSSGGNHHILSPSLIYREGVWGVAHELGHVNQIRPALKWHGTTEVTNNFYSILTQWKYCPDMLNLERYRHNDGDGNIVLGGRFNAYLNNGVMRGQPWPCQKGPDSMTNYENGGDAFVRLCPFWQLFLYFELMEGTEWHAPDWYRNIAEKARQQDDSGKTGSQLQLQFMRDVCDQTGIDLSDFFIKAGMLVPIDIQLDDYAVQRHVLTEADCQSVIQYASRYPKPSTPVLNYLSANSLEAFRDKAAVQGVYNSGVRGNESDEYLIVDHSVWRNVVVFETYSGDEMVRVAMAGTDSSYQTSTLVRYPTGSTRIEAVAWDGTRTLVYGNR